MTAITTPLPTIIALAYLVGPIIGGTGCLAGITGMARTLASANPKEGMVEAQVDIEYWLPQ